MTNDNDNDVSDIRPSNQLLKSAGYQLCCRKWDNGGTPIVPGISRNDTPQGQEAITWSTSKSSLNNQRF